MYQDPRGAVGSRQLTAEEQKKQSQAQITMQFPIDTITISEMKAAFSQAEPNVITKRPEGNGAWDLLHGECLVRLRGNEDRGVFTCISGIEKGIVEHVGKDEPELIRDLVEQILQPVGFVQYDISLTSPDLRSHKVSGIVGGTYPIGAPSSYNFGGAGVDEEAGEREKTIQQGNGFVMVPPNLKDPIQHGTFVSGRPLNKITMVARPANKTAAGTTALNLMSRMIHNPSLFRKAMAINAKIADVWINMSSSVIAAFEMAHLMCFYRDLKAGICTIDQGKFPELYESGRQTPENIVATYAELIGAIPRGAVWGRLSAKKRTFWVEHAFALKNSMMPVPHHESKAYNIKYAFGFVGVVGGQAQLLGSEGSTIKETPIGQIYAKSLTSVPNMFQAVIACGWEERRKIMGVAHSSVNALGEGFFNAQIIPGGGVGDLV